MPAKALTLFLIQATCIFPLLSDDKEHASAFRRSLKGLEQDWIDILFNDALGGDLLLPDIKLEIGTLEENVLSSSIGAEHTVEVHNDMLVGSKANHGKYDFVSLLLLLLLFHWPRLVLTSLASGRTFFFLFLNQTTNRCCSLKSSLMTALYS